MSRFDAAIVEGNYPQQAQVVAIMTELDKEKSIAKVLTAHAQQCLRREAHLTCRPTSSFYARGAQGVVGTCAGVAPS